MSDWIQAVATVILGIIGLTIANNYRRQIRASLVLRTADSFSRLWELTNIRYGSLMDTDTRARTAKRFRDWYFGHGDGLYLTAATRKLFFCVIAELEGDIGNIYPDRTRQRLADMNEADQNRHLGCLSPRHMSLLRTQLKNDLAVYKEGMTFHFLREDERELLEECAIRPASRFFHKRATPARMRTADCLCGFCDGPTAGRSQTSTSGRASSRHEQYPHSTRDNSSAQVETPTALD